MTFVSNEGRIPPSEWEDGVTHMDRSSQFWSGQFKGYIQYRQLIPNNVCNNFTHEKFLKYTEDLDI
jgi:hypothetical protein